MAFVTLALAWFAAVPGQTPEAPFAVFQRVVYCGPGWRVEVNASGRAHQKVEDSCVQEKPYSRDYELSSEDVRSLRRAIEEADFSSLPDEVHAEAVYPDEDAFVITVFDDGKEKRVLARGLERATSPQAARFRKVWDVLVSLVPDPRASDRR